MSPLSLDMSRCAGRIGLGPFDPICNERETCARYRTIEIDQVPDYRGVPFATHMRDDDGVCRGKIEVVG